MNTFLKLRGCILLLTIVVLAACQDRQHSLDEGLVGYWPLLNDAVDQSPGKLETTVHGSLAFGDENQNTNQGFAVFDGTGAWLEVPSFSGFGVEDFSVSGWFYTDSALNDVPGDLLSQYDAATRTGFNLSLKENATATSHSNFRHLTFGIDADVSSGWIDCGRPGNALLAFGMADYKGDLYAGTCEVGVDESGHVYRYAGGTSWEDCGSPDSSNSVTALAVLGEDLYVATGHYRVGGSSLPESENTTAGGRVYRYAGGTSWEDCGRLPGVETIGGMVVYKGSLYASSMYAPGGLFRYDGDKSWVSCGSPDGKRVVALAVYDGYLYATSWDWGHVYRYDGKIWEDCGQVGGEENTQTYAFAVYEGGLYVATWRSGRVYRFEGVNKWKDVGRLGQELEVMGMLVHNGRLMGGTLPLGEVYVYEGDTVWSRMDQLDKTPDVTYRRAWTMAEHDGMAYCSTLPSGKIYGFEAGKSTMSKGSLDAGWHHVLAMRSKDQLRLYVDGQLVSEKALPASEPFNLDGNTPLKIGFGPNDYFAGRMRELRLYNRALNEKEIKALAKM